MTPEDIAAAWPDGPRAILSRAVKDIEKLDTEKADAKDVAALKEAVDRLTRTLQWFMGIVASAVIAFAVIVVQVVGA